MSVATQLKKGVLEGCILKQIEKGETYGYQICEDLAKNGFADIGEGTVYPILVRLEKKGLLDVTVKASPLGPKRKYFKLSDEGRAYLAHFAAEWQRMVDVTKGYFG